MYRAHWEARKIVDIPAGDMTREGWEWTSSNTSPEQLEAITLNEGVVGLPGSIHLALKYQRLYGAGLVYLGLKGENGETSEEPVIDENISAGDLVYTKAIPSFLVSSPIIDNDPLSQNYHNPEIYIIHGRPVHRSRFLVFSGDVVAEPFHGQASGFSLNTKLGFGESALECLFGEIQDAQGSRQSVSHLLHKLSVAIIQKKGLRAKKATNRGGEVIEEMSDAVQSMSNFRMLMLDAEDTVYNYSSNANAGEGLIIAFLQVLSAASDIAATRFLNQAPGGLNSSGDSDIRNYYDRIKADQRNDLLPPLTRAGQIISRSLFGSEIPGLTVEFNPLWQMTEKEQAEIREINARTVNSMVTAGYVLEEDAQKEAEERGVVLNKLKSIEPPEEEPINLGLPPIDGDVDDGEGDR
jgi:phage-related protein (TIGR01555 family)